MRDANRLIKDCIFYLVSRLLPPKIFLKIIYKKIFDKSLYLKNPKTLTEKIQWRKIYDKKKIYSVCSDKYAVRDYVKKKIGRKYLVPLLFHTDKPEKISFDKIKLPFIIKANHGSSMNIIVKNRGDLDKEEIMRKCKKWLKINYYYASKEWQYGDIKPTILIERLLLDENSEIPTDYKFNCFNGKVEFIQVDSDRFGDHKKSFYNAKWKFLPFVWCGEKDGRPLFRADKDVDKPRNLNKMIKLSKKLSKNFDYVRVDFYSLKNKVYFGELTFTPSSGFDKFFPSKYDEIFGKLWNIKK